MPRPTAEQIHFSADGKTVEWRVPVPETDYGHGPYRAYEVSAVVALMVGECKRRGLELAGKPRCPWTGRHDLALVVRRLVAEVRPSTLTY